MPCFFDDCVFGANTDPVIGKQPEPLEGWYAWLVAVSGTYDGDRRTDTWTFGKICEGSNGTF